MNEKSLISPCISICKTDPISGFCYGCGRSNDEKKTWKNPNTHNNWKKENLRVIRNRLTGWQKKAFDESYTHKKNTGLSLIKKKLSESQK